MRIRMLLSVAVLTWSAAACTDGHEPAKSPTSASPQTIDKPTASPLRFGAEPLWTERTKGAPRYADGFALHGDSVVVVSGPKGGQSDRLSVINAANGRVRWSITIWQPLRGGHGDQWDGLGPFDTTAPPVVDRGRDWGVLIVTAQHHDSIQAPYGLALLSGKNGSVLWRRTVVAEKKSGELGKSVYPDTVTGNDDLALMHLRTSVNPMVADTRLVALDPRTGKRLWTRSSVGAAALVSRTVVAIEWPHPAETPLDSSTKSGTVTVLDTATGQDRWSLRDRMPVARALAAVNGLVVVRNLQNFSQQAPVLLDMGTGTEVGSLPSQTRNCFDDRANLIACDFLTPPTSLTSGLLTIRADERRVQVAGHPPPDGDIIDLVQDGRIYYSGVNTPGEEIDRSGTPLTKPLPTGSVGALSNRYAVFGVSETQQYRVYSVS